MIESPQRLDKFALAVLSAVIVLPFPGGVFLSVGGALVSAEEICELLLICIATVLVSLRHVKLGPVESITFSAILTVLAITQLAKSNLRVSPEAIFQARSFLPFATAIAVIATPWRLSRVTVVHAVFLAVIASGVIAVVLHIGFRDQLPVWAGENEQTAIALESGRMYWNRNLVAMLAPLVLCVSSRVVSRAHAVGLLFIFIATALTQGRTALLGFLLATAVCLIALGNNKRGLVFAVVTSLVAGFIGVALVALVMSEAELTLFAQRLGLDGPSAEVERAVIAGRLPAYEQHMGAILTSPITGSGLGTALFVTPSGEKIFTSDVSMVHVLVPFGLVGLSGLGWFVWVCWRRVRLAGCVDPCSRACGWLVLIAAAISLNHDPFLRNVFVVALAFTIASQTSRVTLNRARSLHRAMN